MEQAYCKLPACNEQRICCRKGACCILSPLPFSECELHMQNPANKWPNTPSSQTSLCKCYDSSLLVGPPTELICRGKENLSRVKFKLYKHLPEFLSAWGFCRQDLLVWAGAATVMGVAMVQIPLLNCLQKGKLVWLLGNKSALITTATNHPDQKLICFLLRLPLVL